MHRQVTTWEKMISHTHLPQDWCAGRDRLELSNEKVKGLSAQRSQRTHERAAADVKPAGRGRAHQPPRATPIAISQAVARAPMSVWGANV